MTELGTALRELADQHQRVGGPDPSELWNRGRQRVQRRRVLAGVTVAALALVVGGLGVAGPESRLISPASEPHGPGIPKNIEDPPSWLPVAAYGTKVGPLSVLARGMRHGRMELFGINAKTGKYRFLPNGEVQIPDTPVALSPNGRYAAYWSGSDGKTVTNLTVFDTVTGTESGLSTGENEYGFTAGPLTWLDDKTVLLAFEVNHAPDVQPGPAIKVETFGPGGRGPELVQVQSWPQSTQWSRDRDGTLLEPRLWRINNEATPQRWQSLGNDLRRNGPSFILAHGNYRQVSRSGDLVAAIGSTGSFGSASSKHVALLAGRPGRGTTYLHDVGDLYVGTLLGWRSADSVLVTGWQHAPNGQASLFEANVRTGKVKRVGDAGDDADVVLAVASDLLEKPLVDPNPPKGLNPRIVHGIELAGFLLLLAGFLYWRRRARD